AAPDDTRNATPFVPPAPARRQGGLARLAHFDPPIWGKPEMGARGGEGSGGGGGREHGASVAPPPRPRSLRSRGRPSPPTGGRVATAPQYQTAASASPMSIALLGQYLVNGLMLGMMYGLVAVGFTLFFGVLDVIKFSHGDVLTVGAFTAFATYLGVQAAVSVPWLQLIIVSVAAMLSVAVLGALIARYLVLPLRSAPALNTLLITLMLGTVLRESVRLFFPDGSNPKPFPALLPRDAFTFGLFTLRLDSVILFVAGLAMI